MNSFINWVGGKKINIKKQDFNSLGFKEKKAVYNLGLIRWFIMFIIKLMKVYYG